MVQTLTISWDTPIQNDGSQQMTGYTLSYKKVSESTYTKITGVTSPYVLSGLTSGTNYDICIQSNCSPSCISEMLCTTALTNPDPTPTPTPSSTPTPTPTPTPTSTTIPPTATPTNTPTPTPTPSPTNDPNVLYELSSRMGTLSEVCGGGGTPMSIWYYGQSIQLGEVLYSDNGEIPTPVSNGYYYVAQYNTIYYVSNGQGNVANTVVCPTATPNVFEISGLYVDSTDQLVCDSPQFGPISISGYGLNIVDGISGFIGLSGALTSYLGADMWVKQRVGGVWYIRKYTRSGNSAFDSGGSTTVCVPGSTPVPTATATTPPQITVNIWGRQSTPYDDVTNNLQLIYQTYSAPNLGPLNYTTSGIQKALTDSGTFLVSPNVNAGANLNLGAFLRETDGICDYVGVNVNVFAEGSGFISSRFTDSTGSLLSTSGCSLQGTLNGVTIPISQSIDVYLTILPTGGCGGGGTAPLECLTTPH